MMAMIIIDVWKTAPFMALLLLAGLQVIPGDVYEAADVDGASVWQRFFRITLPLLKPAIVVALLFRTLDAWRVFDMFYVVAGSRLQSISTYAFNQLVVSAINFPVGAAATVLIFIGASVISVVFIKGFGAQTGVVAEGGRETMATNATARPRVAPSRATRLSARRILLYVAVVADRAVLRRARCSGSSTRRSRTIRISSASPPTLLPARLTFHSFSRAFTDHPTFAGNIKNSVIIAGASTIISLLFGCLGRLRHRPAALQGACDRPGHRAGDHPVPADRHRRPALRASSTNGTGSTPTRR